MILLLAMQTATLGATNYRVDAPMTIPDRAPTFTDEFAGTSVDSDTWRFDTSQNATGWPNHELEYYSDANGDNARVANGALTIIARRETPSKADRPDWGGQHYTSAKLISRRPFGYGTYEIRAKLPCGRGMWPAVWLLPSGGTWPDNGEIDIMEMVGWDPNVVHATLHTKLYNHRLGTQRGADVRVPTACSAFHRYQLEWRLDAIAIGIDGRAYMRVANDRPGGAGAWPFTRPFDMILNLAVGGDWGGKAGVDDAALPQSMTIDYVRYWAGPVTASSSPRPAPRP